MGADLRQDRGVPVAAALATVAVLLMVFLPSFLSRRARDSVEREAVDLVGVAASLAAPAVHAGDAEALLRVVDALQAVPEVTYAVVSRGDEVLAGDGPEGPATAGAWYAQGLLHVAMPIPDVEPPALVRIGYGLGTYQRARVSHLALASLLALLLLVAAALAGVFGRAPRAPDPTARLLTGERFLAHLSHEMRTPLNAIIGYSEILQEDAVFLEQHDFVPDLRKIQRAGRHLLALVDDVVALSRVVAGEMDLVTEDFEVAAVVDDAVAEVQSLIDRTLVTLTVERDPRVRRMTADRQKVERALVNVLREAAGATAQGRLELSVEPRGGEVLFHLVQPDLELTDEEISSVVHDFSEERTRGPARYAASGLGLVISRAFCELQGGGLEVRRGEGGGTIFEMWVPSLTGR